MTVMNTSDNNTHTTLNHHGRTFTVPTGLFINNKFVPSISGKTFKTVDPATGAVICEVYEGLKEDVDAAVTAAKKALPGWLKVTPEERGKLLNNLVNLIEREKVTLAEIEAWDNGKNVNEALNVDLELVISNLRYYAGWADK
ncbi:hypothetical protein HDU76_010481, partial [Blyttiomyces sp. JEL0837]